jgi:dihydrofolate reductase
MTVSIIVAMAENRVIGNEGRIPWHIPEDTGWFKGKTLGHTVIMGRKTFESIGRPLPGRKNIIISRKPDYTADGAEVFHSLEQALESSKGTEDELFIIGGEKIYRQAIGITDRIYLTLINRRYEGDTTFPELPDGEFKEVFKKLYPGDPSFTLLILERRR